jgi:TRAP-type C4-dicarboxylate transport system substrate-binding protein
MTHSLLPLRKLASLAAAALAMASLSAVTSFSTEADAATTLKIGTLAPGDSAWGKEFKKWAKAVSDDTNGELVLDFQWNGQAGDEVLMVQKMRSGQLDGAAVTAVGLAQTGVTDVLLFQMPGLFSNWGKLDAARTALKADFDSAFQSKGFTILGWGDVGAAKTMTIGFEVHHPADLQGKGCFFLAGDPVTPKLYSAIGGINAKEVTVPEILPNLTNGSIQVLTVPPLVAEQLQWASRVTHINTMTTGFGIGAILMSTPKVAGLPDNLKNALITRSTEAGERLTKSIRNLDAQSFSRLKASKSAYEPSDAEKNEWKDLFGKIRAQLRGSVFSPAMFDKVVGLAQ